ncbi:MAG: hypothetical protein Ct9H90mP16_01720 [Candidatus Poseidoniales archaeon]|nr:MAG: hypothetical protein Ct9H90mP16_01720 [Candidatus Poseidoniales archaeon]
MTPGCGNNNSATLVVWSKNVIPKKSKLKYSRTRGFSFPEKPWPCGESVSAWTKGLSLKFKTGRWGHLHGRRSKSRTCSTRILGRLFGVDNGASHEENDAFIQALMDHQEKLHFSIGRRRKRASIGVHDLSTLAPPFRVITVPESYTPLYPSL